MDYMGIYHTYIKMSLCRPCANICYKKWFMQGLFVAGKVNSQPGQPIDYYVYYYYHYHYCPLGYEKGLPKKAFFHFLAPALSEEGPIFSGGNLCNATVILSRLALLSWSMMVLRFSNWWVLEKQKGFSFFMADLDEGCCLTHYSGKER